MERLSKDTMDRIISLMDECTAEKEASKKLWLKECELRTTGGLGQGEIDGFVPKTCHSIGVQVGDDIREEDREKEHHTWSIDQGYTRLPSVVMMNGFAEIEESWSGLVIKVENHDIDLQTSQSCEDAVKPSSDATANSNGGEILFEHRYCKNGLNTQPRPEREEALDILSTPFTSDSATRVQNSETVSGGSLKTIQSRRTSCKEREFSLITCIYCGMGFTTQSHLNAHKQIHVGEKRFKCDFCGRGFRVRRHLDRHRRTHTGEVVCRCEICGRGFGDVSYLKTHHLTHTGEKPFTCEVCGKGFVQVSHLTTHRLIHKGEKAFVCVTCGKRYRQACHLKNHKLVHTGEKPFLCATCGKSFTLATSLKSHAQTHSEEAPESMAEKTFACDICGKAFVFRSALETHRSVHTGEKPFSCEVCGKRFRLANCLKNHQTVHTREKLFNCTICGKNFSTKTNLCRHRGLHKEEKPFNCLTCGKTFRLRCYLKTHQQTHERGNTSSGKVNECPSTHS